MYLYLGERKPVLRTKPVDDGVVWTKVSAAVEQVRTRSERHNVNIAALNERSQRQEVTPEFLAHLAFTHCGDSVAKLMRKHPELNDFNLGSPGRVVARRSVVRDVWLRTGVWVHVQHIITACHTHSYIFNVRIPFLDTNES